MRFERCSNPGCRRPFQVNEFAGMRRETGLIVCPHCGHGETRYGDSVYVVHALSEQEEAEFNRLHPLNIDDDLTSSAA